MTHLLHSMAFVLMILFLIGVAGCAVSVPIIAVKFASVLFEKDHADENNPNVAPVEETRLET